MRVLRVLLIMLGLFAPTTAALGHDEPLTDAELKAMNAAIGLAKDVAAGGRPAPDDLGRMDVLLKSVSTDRFDHFDNLSKQAQLPSGDAEVLRRMLRSLEVLRSLRTRVSAPVPIAFYIASANPVDVGRAMHLLSAEKFGEEFIPVLVKLAKDERPEVRCNVGALAKCALLFTGKEQGYVEIAEQLLVDPNPNVAATFGRAHGPEFLSTRVYDKMVGRFRDDRKPISAPREFLSCSESTVGDAIANGFTRYFARWGGQRYPKDGTASPLPVDNKAAALSAWWEKNRGTWTGGPERAGWALVYDGTVELVPGRVTSLVGAMRDVGLRLAEYAVKDRAWTPEVSLSVEVHDKALYGGKAFLVGNPMQRLGYIATAGNESYTIRLLALPGPGSGVRARVWLWFKDPTKPQER